MLHKAEKGRQSSAALTADDSAYWKRKYFSIPYSLLAKRVYVMSNSSVS